MFWVIVTFFVNYLFGSVLFGVIIGKSFYNVNILSLGSKSPGATNARRVLGKRAGIIVFILDFMKGFLGTSITILLFKNSELNIHLMAMIAIMGVILGHSFSIFWKFKGGKGVSVSIGGLFAIMPIIVSIALVIWWIVLKLTHYVSVASMAFGITLPICAFVFKRGMIMILFTLIIMLVIFLRHKTNIKRLLSGTENRT